MTHLEPLPLSETATFRDLIFRPHPDGHPGHLQALHIVPWGTLSVTMGGLNDGADEAPFEAMTPDGEVHAPLTAAQVNDLMLVLGQAPEV